MNMNSGYVGWSKSRRAYEAEDAGLLPLSRIGRSSWIGAAAKIVGAGEWHHTSKFCNKTEYFDVRAVRAVAVRMKALAGSPAEALAIIRSLRHARMCAGFGCGSLGQGCYIIARATDMIREARALEANDFRSRYWPRWTPSDIPAAAARRRAEAHNLVVAELARRRERRTRP